MSENSREFEVLEKNLKKCEGRPCSFTYYEKVTSDTVVLILRLFNIDYCLYFRTFCLTKTVHFDDETGHRNLSSIQKLHIFLRGVPSQTSLHRTLKNCTHI